MAKGNAWLARDGGHTDDDGYVLFDSKPTWNKDSEQWFGPFGVHDCIGIESVPHACKLAPGDGPIPVRISIERAE